MCITAETKKQNRIVPWKIRDRLLPRGETLRQISGMQILLSLNVSTICASCFAIRIMISYPERDVLRARLQYKPEHGPDSLDCHWAGKRQG